MPLLRQIGSTGAQALLAAAGGKVGDTTMNPTDPIFTPTPVAATVSVPVPVQAIDPSLKTLLWAGLGLGVGWWLGRDESGRDHLLAGTGGKSMVPLLIVGGLAAWYFLTPKEDPAVTARLLSWSTGAPQYPQLPATVAALSTADRATLYTIITQYFDKSLPLPDSLQAFWNAKLAAAVPASTIPPTGPAGLPLSGADAARQWLLNTFQASNAPNEASLKAAVPQMTDDEAVSFYNVLQYIQQQGPSFNGVLPAAMQNAFNFVMQKYGIPGL